MFTDLITAASSEGVMVGLAAVATVITTYLIKRRNADASLTVDERKQLSMDEHDFRKSILTQLKACQEAHRQASEEREFFRKLSVTLEMRVTELETNCFSCLYRASGQDTNFSRNHQ